MKHFWRKLTVASLALGVIGTGLAGPAAAASPPAPTNLTGQIINNRANLDWSDVAGARDYVVFDVSSGAPGRVVGTTRTSDWTSVNLPGRESFTWEVVARDAAKQQGARSEPITLYPGGAPEEPEEPTEPPTEPEEPPVTPPPPTDPPVDQGITLGVAVNPEFLTEGPYRQTVLDNFTGVTSENGMKFRSLQPQRGQFTFEQADATVNLAIENGMKVRGHTLAWFGGNPSWVTQVPVAERAAVLENHITTVVNHFEGRIAAWDVWNEAVADDGSGLRTDSPWNPQGTIEPVVAAFKAARAADPNVALCVNDFSVEFNRAKVDAYYQFVTDLRAAGAPVDCVGFQGHLMTETEDYADTRTDPGGWSPTQAEWQAIAQRFADIPGIDHIQLTEVDVRTNDTPESFTRAQRDQAQALVVENLARGCAAVTDCDWIGFWNLRERDSWLGPDAEATIFTDDYQAKPAYDVVREIVGDRN